MKQSDERLNMIVPKILRQAKLEMVSNTRLKNAVKDLDIDGECRYVAIGLHTKKKFFGGSQDTHAYY